MGDIILTNLFPVKFDIFLWYARGGSLAFRNWLINRTHRSTSQLLERQQDRVVCVKWSKLLCQVAFMVVIRTVHGVRRRRPMLASAIPPRRVRSDGAGFRKKNWTESICNQKKLDRWLNENGNDNDKNKRLNRHAHITSGSVYRTLVDWNSVKLFKTYIAIAVSNIVHRLQAD